MSEAETSLVSVAVDSKTFNDVGRLPHSTCLLRDFGQSETVRLALELLPGTRRLAIVGGPMDPQSYSRFFYSQIVEEFAERLEIIDLCGLPLAEIRTRAAHLPPDTVLVLTAMAVDGGGRPFTHPQVVAEIAPVANAPMFGSIETELGHGTVGGDLFDPGKSGRETAALVARILNGEKAESIEPRLSDSSVVAFDWRQLERWGIPERRLPPDSVIEFKPPTLWQSHRRTVGLALAIFLAQGVSIAALLRARARRRRIDRVLRELSGRLITAQEDERRRVARELNDDVSQRLALLAIELESPGGTEHLGDTAAKVQDLARDVHAIAHHLQPPHLEGEGLARELKAYCDEVSARHGLRIDCRLPEHGGDLPADSALALYRVAQEAVQNAVKHSGADEVSVELGVSPRWASVTVVDNGRGFDSDRSVGRRALGIAGMRERMRLVGGWLGIESAPGDGATVSAWVPLEPRSEGEGP
jgi:signal transduction histidine kinase